MLPRRSFPTENVKLTACTLRARPERGKPGSRQVGALQRPRHSVGRYAVPELRKLTACATQELFPHSHYLVYRKSLHHLRRAGGKASSLVLIRHDVVQRFRQRIVVPGRHQQPVNSVANNIARTARAVETNSRESG